MKRVYESREASFLQGAVSEVLARQLGRYSEINLHECGFPEAPVSQDRKTAQTKHPTAPLRRDVNYFPVFLFFMVGFVAQPPEEGALASAWRPPTVL